MKELTAQQKFALHFNALIEHRRLDTIDDWIQGYRVTLGDEASTLCGKLSAMVQTLAHRNFNFNEAEEAQKLNSELAEMWARASK